MNNIITLREYLAKGAFVVPPYQRGYVWGKKPDGDKPDSVSYILNTLLQKFELTSNRTVFLQGITVTEKGQNVILIDGQQRTTFLYLLLVKCLDYQGDFSIQYDIRPESGRRLAALSPTADYSDYADAEYQDEAFFKKSICIIRQKLANILADGTRKAAFREFLLDDVRFLYIPIPESQATTVFTMMNGNREPMLQQDIIKAELLRLISLEENGSAETAWELDALRGRYAREWDKWVHWWDRQEVRSWLTIKGNQPLQELFVALDCADADGKPSFDAFVTKVLKLRTRQGAREAFDRMRRVQKRFEDAFNNSICHNYVGGIVRVLTDASKFIRWYFDNLTHPGLDLHSYYLCAFMGMSHDDIVSGKQVSRDKFNDFYDAIKADDIYNDGGRKPKAFNLLLRLNIDEDNLQERYFNFDAWANKSLEHIMAKSTVYHFDNGVCYLGNGSPYDGLITDKMTNRADMGTIPDPADPQGEPLPVTEHCIGNLVLLYDEENTKFGVKDFEEKKNIFLTGRYMPEKGDKYAEFKSRHLLHSIYKFASSDWGPSEIAANFAQTLSELRTTYKDLLTPEDEQQD